MDHILICPLTECLSRQTLSDEEIKEQKLPMAIKDRTCEFCGSSTCKADQLFEK